jgi:dTDP-4-dehydrorhamnose reductase
MRYERLLDARNSISQLNEFVRTAIHLWERRCPFGTYHVTNPGSITTREIVDLIQQHLRVKKNFQFFASESEFMQVAAKTPRSNCVLDTSKLQSTGIQLTPVHDAVERALKEWREASSERRVASSE